MRVLCGLKEIKRDCLGKLGTDSQSKGVCVWLLVGKFGTVRELLGLIICFVNHEYHINRISMFYINK